MPEFGTRHTLVTLAFFGVLNVYFCRLNLSMAIVAMVKSAPVSFNASVSSVHCAGGENVGAAVGPPFLGGEAEYDWDPGIRGDLLGSYYYGYIWTQIPGGWLAARYGFKRVFGVSMLLSGLITLLTPLAAESGLAFLIAVRVLIGFFHGVAFPAMHGAWTVWAPPDETSKLVAFYVAGCSVGTVLIFPLSGVLAATLGWRAIFYVTGSLTLVWCVAWTFLVFDSPAQHPRITVQERQHIESSIAEVRKGEGPSGKTPWRAILTSPVVWAVSVAHLASNWGNYQLNSMMPTYLATVLRFDIKSNGFISALPFLLQSLVCFFGGWLTDFVRRRGLLRTVTVRKVNTGLGLLVPAVTVVLAGYMGCRSAWAVLFFTLSVGFNSFTVPGSKTSPLDFAPAHAGVIMGVSNMVANLSGFLAPQTTGHLLSGSNTLGRWQIAFWISAFVYVPGFVVFLVFGTDQLQQWAKQPRGSEKEGCNESAEVTKF